MSTVGTTKVRACCTFLWAQDEQRQDRSVLVRPYHCAACVAEVVATAKQNRTSVLGSVPMDRVRGVLSRDRGQIIDRWTRQLRAAAEAGFALDEASAEILPALLTATDRALQRRFRPIAPGLSGADAEGQRAAVQCSLLSDFLIDAVLEARPGLSPPEQRMLQDAIAHAAVEVVVSLALRREEAQKRKESARFARLAHELRDQMTAARLSLDLLRKRGVPFDSTPGRALERSLRKLRDGIEDSLLDEILTAGGLRLEPIKLGQLLADVTLFASELGAREKNLRVVFDRSPPLEVSADPRIVGPAVRGLLRAAVELSRKGATVRLQGLRTRSSAQLAFAVDRCRSPVKRLGSMPCLSLARRAARAHGGTITARALPFEGCVLTLELPSPGA